jgi:apolipoprotein N-acyltransferase
LLAVRRASPRDAALLGLLSGILTDGLGVSWLLGSGVSPGAFCLLILFAASKYAVFGFGACLVYRHRGAAAPLALPVLWVGLEWLRANLGWLSIPWGLLGYSQYEVGPLVRAASVAGVYGVSWVLLAVNVAVAELIVRCSEQAARRESLLASRALALCASLSLAAAILAMGHLGSLSEPATRPAPGVRLAIIQAGVYDPAVHDVRERDAIFDGYLQLTRQVAAGKDLDLVIWPESSVPVAFPHDTGAVGVLFRLAEEIDTRLLVAASGRDKRSRVRRAPQIANSAFLIGPAREIEGRYDKVRLLPFDEYVPLRDWISWPTWITSVRRDAIPGSRLGVLETAGLRYGVQVCFESLFASEGRRTARQGVDFLVTLTNESFAGPENAHELLFAMNLFRAAENGLPLVRATTTTISAVVAADGTVVERASGNPAILVADLPAASAPTLYRRFGDATLLILAGFALAALIAARRSRRPSDAMPWPEQRDSGASESLP